MSGIRLPDSFKLVINRKNDNYVTTCWHDVIAKFFWHCYVSLVKFSYWFKFHVNIFTSSRVLWQFSFIRDWPEIRKSEIPLSEFCRISGDWGELGTSKLARMSLIKCYWMLQYTRVTAVTIPELFREDEQGGKIILHPYYFKKTDKSSVLFHYASMVLLVI